MPRQKAKKLPKKYREILKIAHQRIRQIPKEIMDLEEEQRSCRALVLILEPSKPR